MKSSTKFLGMAIGAMAFGMLVSCSNDIGSDSPSVTPSKISGKLLVHDPDITVWSGKTTFGNTRADAPQAPGALSAEEIAAAKSFFDSGKTSLGEYGSMDDLADWKNYYVQDVSQDRPATEEEIEYSGPNDEKIVNLKIWNIDPTKVANIIDAEDYDTADGQVGIEDELTEPQYVSNHQIKEFSFETKTTTGGDTKIVGSYPKSWSPAVRVAKLNGYDGIYVAFYGYDDHTYGENGLWDRIIKLTKVEVANDDETEGDIEEEDVIFNDKIMHSNEVEVNLSISDLHNKYNIEDLVTKLSIHVRYPHDVRVIIPVPTEKLVPADDLDIVLSHKELLESYGENSKATFDIAGNTVELEVNYTDKIYDCQGHETDGTYIEVTTHGINLDVMKYCLQHYGDGVNFEVYNYYQWNITDQYGFTSRRKPTKEEVEDLKYNWLDESQVEFGYGNWNVLDESMCPYYYINAFNNDRSVENPVGTQYWNDCYVRVSPCQASWFSGEFTDGGNIFTGPHTNGSDWNVIYVREDIYGTNQQDDAHTPHNVQNSVN